MADIIQVTPFLHVPDLAQAMDFFTRILRFEVKFEVANYVYLERGNAGIRILEERGRQPAGLGEPRVTVYLDVRDVDALYAELLPELRTLKVGDVQPPGDQSWDQREFQVRLPDGHWLTFGMPLRAKVEPRQPA